MSLYENEIRMMAVPPDSFSPHQHCGIHPYVVLKNCGNFCLVAPCTSNVNKRSLPTQVLIKTFWAKETMVLLEQMISISTETVMRGKYCATLCDEDVANVYNAALVQLGIKDVRKNENAMRGKVFRLSLPANSAIGRYGIESDYIVVSNEACNKYSPVVHVMPLSKFKRLKTPDGKALYKRAETENICFNKLFLVPKSALKEEFFNRELDDGCRYLDRRMSAMFAR